MNDAVKKEGIDAVGRMSLLNSPWISKGLACRGSIERVYAPARDNAAGGIEGRRSEG
jgi:hypothetical protein